MNAADPRLSSSSAHPQLGPCAIGEDSAILSLASPDQSSPSWVGLAATVWPGAKP